LFFARSAKKLDSLNFSLPCRAANDFTVSHETNSLPENKMYVARLKKFSLQKLRDLPFSDYHFESIIIFFSNLPLKDPSDIPDPYVRIKVMSHGITTGPTHRTKVNIQIPQTSLFIHHS
jgi:hypothetical protein